MWERQGKYTDPTELVENKLIFPQSNFVEH